jgi:hypothetical protein
LVSNSNKKLVEGKREEKRELDQEHKREYEHESSKAKDLIN